MGKKLKPKPFNWDEMADDFSSPLIIGLETISAQLDWLIRLACGKDKE